MVAGRGYVPDRGDLVWLTFSPQSGHEQSGRRPAVVLSPASYNGRVGLALMCPVTSRTKGYPFEVILPQGLEVAGAVLCDQVKSLDWQARQAQQIARLPEGLTAQILARVMVLLKPTPE